MSEQYTPDDYEACNDISHLKNALVLLEADISNHYSRLELESVWLFLATLGCWSVSIRWVQLIAYIFTFILFTTRIKVGLKDKRSFPKRLKVIQSNVSRLNNEEDSTKALCWDCQDLSKRISIMRSPVNVPTYISVYLFFVVSLCFCLFQLNQ
jgi:hypothetical protein